MEMFSSPLCQQGAEFSHIIPRFSCFSLLGCGGWMKPHRGEHLRPASVTED